MKSEERQQLLTNDLGVVTTRTVGFFERHLGLLIGAVCLALLLAGGIYWWTNTTDTEAATGWTLLDTSQNLEDFGGVVDKFKGKPPGQWAQLFMAETNLKTAMPLMFTNREIALTDLKAAREGFESLLQEKASDPTIRERALWGYALCLETASDGNTSKAIEAFERLKDEFPESIFKAVADERIAALKKDDAKEFYAWFSRENPKPPDARPRDGRDENSSIPGGGLLRDEPDDFLIRDPKESKKPESTADQTDAVEGKTEAGSKDEPAEPTSEAPAENPTEENPTDTEKTPAAEKKEEPAKEESPSAANNEKPVDSDKSGENDKPVENDKPAENE